MNNIDRIKEYIQDDVIAHLERLMNGDNGEPEVNLYEKYGLQGGYPPKDAVYKSLLHAMMVPYYKMYLNGDYQLCKPNMEFIRLQMKRVIDDDEQFGRWASEQDLIISAEGWGDNLKRIPEDERIKKQYFFVLKALLQTDCQQDWHRLSEELKDMLFKAEVYSDYKTDEVLCALHAFTMIMQQDWTKEKKIENLELLRQQWKFMKHYYSVMIRHIVGVKWTQFDKVAETVMTSPPSSSGSSSPSSPPLAMRVSPWVATSSPSPSWLASAPPSASWASSSPSSPSSTWSKPLKTCGATPACVRW